MIVGLAVLGVVAASGIAIGLEYHENNAGRHSTDLQSLLIPVPAGTHPWKSKPTDQTLDLAGAAAFSSVPSTGKEMLSRDDFKRGIVRRWVIDADGTFVELQLLQFDETDDAAQYFDSFEQGNNKTGWQDEAGVPGLGDAKSFVGPTTDKNGYRPELSFAQAGDIVIVVETTQAAPVSVSVGNALLASQYARL